MQKTDKTSLFVFYVNHHEHLVEKTDTDMTKSIKRTLCVVIVISDIA